MSGGALLLDLDGTLVDTAPDMVACLNRLLEASGEAAVDYAQARNQVSNGAVGLLTLGFRMTPEDRRMADLRRRYLELYASCLSDNSIIFNDFTEVFDTLSEIGWSWGVVTNKPQDLARPLLAALGLKPDAACVIGGDTLPQRKPHPAPLLHAAAVLGRDPARCLYVGDAERDIQAGRAAGMRTAAARYGYLEDPTAATRWGADHVIDSPRELTPLLRALASETRHAG